MKMQFYRIIKRFESTIGNALRTKLIESYQLKTFYYIVYSLIRKFLGTTKLEKELKCNIDSHNYSLYYNINFDGEATL